MFLTENIARVDLEALARPKRAVVRLSQFLIGLGDQINRDKVIIRASGLAYSSLLAAVPLIAVVFALLSAFGALDVRAGTLGTLAVQYALTKTFLVEATVGYQKSDVGDIEIAEAARLARLILGMESVFYTQANTPA